MVEKLRLVLWVATFGLIAVFTVQNIESVTVKFLMWDIAMSRAVLIVLLVGIGFLGGWLTARIRAWKKPATTKE